MTGPSRTRRAPARRRVAEPPPHPEERLFEATEYASMRRILLASLDAFAELGFHGTATRDIARRAQVSAGALYTHYASKRALLELIIRVTHEAMLTRMRAAAAEGGSPTETLRRIVMAHVRFHAKYNTATRVANYELHSLDDRARREIRGLRDDMERVVGEVLASGCDRGEFAVEDQQLATMYLLSLGIDVSRWFRSGHRLTPDELATEYARLALHAIAADRTPAAGDRAAKRTTRRTASRTTRRRSAAAGQAS